MTKRHRRISLQFCRQQAHDSETTNRRFELLTHHEDDGDGALLESHCSTTSISKELSESIPKDCMQINEVILSCFVLYDSVGSGRHMVCPSHRLVLLPSLHFKARSIAEKQNDNDQLLDSRYLQDVRMTSLNTHMHIIDVQT